MEFEQNINLKLGVITTTLDGKVYEGVVGFMESQHDMLCGYRDDGREPSDELLADIAAYAYIINHENPSQKAEEYRAGRKQNGEILRPREVAVRLGWDI